MCWGAALIFVAGVFDLMDGALAKVKNQMSQFGAFLDSFVDRYSEAAIHGGLLVFYLQQTPFTGCAGCTDTGQTLIHYLWTGIPAVNVFLIFLTIVGSTMISYARARAGALHVDCEVGLLPRSERVVLIALAPAAQPCHPGALDPRYRHADHGGTTADVRLGSHLRAASALVSSHHRAHRGHRV